MRGVQVVHNIRGVEPGVFCQSSRHNLQRPRELFNSVLVKPGLLPAKRGEAVRQFNLRGAPRGKRPAVLGKRLERVHAVIHGALDVVHHVLRASAKHHGGYPGGGVVLLHDHALGPADLLDVDGRDVPKLVRRRSSELDNANRVCRPAKPPELELGRHLDRHQAVPLDEVHGHLAEALAGNHNLGAAVRDHLHVLLHLLLLAEGVLLQVLGAGD
mmetsp:Transcript_5885/g.19560  ORF Transcript_5885/g.19560 Transcript_5885/m.19560 type:complete len:214 (-) Transcript_5885:871-1512(-)